MVRLSRITNSSRVQGIWMNAMGSLVQRRSIPRVSITILLPPTFLTSRANSGERQIPVSFDKGLQADRAGPAGPEVLGGIDRRHLGETAKGGFREGRSWLAVPSDISPAHEKAFHQPAFETSFRLIEVTQT